MTSPRETIFSNVRSALAEGRAEGWLPPRPETGPAPELDIDRVRLSALASPQQRVARFEAEIEKLGDTALAVATLDTARQWIISDIAEHGYERGVINRDAAEFLGWGEDLPAAGCALEFPRDQDKDQLFAADFGVTLADAGIAETGTLMEIIGPGRARLSSLAPATHYALLPVDRVLADLPVALARLGEAPDGSDAVWITGSSRTADIDGILIHGAHGPKRLVALLVGAVE